MKKLLRVMLQRNWISIHFSLFCVFENSYSIVKVISNYLLIEIKMTWYYIDIVMLSKFNRIN